MNKCWHGTGQNTSLIIETGYFHEANARGIFEIILVHDSVYYIELQGGEKVLDYAEVNVTDSSANLDNSNECYFLRDYEKIKCYLHYADNLQLNLFETCKVSCQNPVTTNLLLTVPAELAEVDILLDNSHFHFYNHKTTGGTYTFRGFSDRCIISGYYSARFVLSDLTSREMHINNSSIGDMHVNANQLLEVEIHNKGNIYYSGSPEIVIDSITGSGRLFSEN
jgi:hypothetical protein